MEWVGFHKYRVGRIHLFCPRCKRKFSNMTRYVHDPKRAVLMHLVCCGEGDKDEGIAYFDARGRELDWETGKPYPAVAWGGRG